jgi:hypothetical protein
MAGLGRNNLTATVRQSSLVALQVSPCLVGAGVIAGAAGDRSALDSPEGARPIGFAFDG